MVGSILMIGAGGLGCAALLALLDSPKSSALDQIVLVDPDQTELSNLHRQILYCMDDLDSAKAERAAGFMRNRRQDLHIQPVVKRLEGVEEIMALAVGCDLILDGSDNFTTRFQANDAAIALGTPLVHGAAIGYTGQLMTIFPGRSSCLRCLFHGPPTTENGSSCRSEGVLGPLVGEIGWLMAIEAVKILWQEGTPLSNQLLTIDANTGRRRNVSVRRRIDCLGCADVGKTIK
jgi:molybdopterin-synthase adenylyltransferase